MMPLEGDEYDDDGAEPTRIADLSGPNSPLSAGMAAAAMRSPPNPASSPRILVSAPMPMPASTPAPVAPAPAAVPRSGKGSSGLTTGIAVGLLAGILLVGGPMLYRNTWGTPTPTPVAEPQPVAEQPKTEDLAVKDIIPDVPAPEAVADTPKNDSKAGGTRKTDPKAPVAPKDGLTDEQRA